MAIPERTRIVRVRNSSAPVSTDGGQSDVIVRCSRWRRAFRNADICYPATLLALPAAANWVYDDGSEVDARSPQGISFALSAGIAPVRVILHCASATG